jgi:hypothetical protein
MSIHQKLLAFPRNEGLFRSKAHLGNADRFGRRRFGGQFDAPLGRLRLLLNIVSRAQTISVSFGFGNRKDAETAEKSFAKKF